MLNVRERAVLEDMKRSRPERAARHGAHARPRSAWRAEFFRNENPRLPQMYSGRRAIGNAPAARGVPARADVAVFRQLALLLSRYWKVKMRDRAGAAIMFLQAPIIGVLLAVVFGGQTAAVPVLVPGRAPGAVDQEQHERERRRRTCSTRCSRRPTTRRPCSSSSCRCVWFGTSNAAREIVTERAIYLRERMVNLRLFNYVVSKYVLLEPLLRHPVHVPARHRLLRARLQRRHPRVPARARERDRRWPSTPRRWASCSRPWCRRPRRRWRSRPSRSSRRSCSAGSWCP